MSAKELLYHLISGKKNNILLFGLSIIPAVLLFQFPVSVFTNGIDPPLSWVFNYLINGKLLLGKDIIFPHGPLAFLMYPLPMGANIWIAVVFHLAARIFLAFSMLKLASCKHIYILVFTFISSFVLLAINDLLLTLVQIVAICYINYFARRNVTWLIPALIIAPLAIYIKAFVGIVSIILTITFTGLMVYRAASGIENWYRLLVLLIVPFVLLGTWFSMYGELSGFTRYFKGMIMLAADNSAAVAVYPQNNWWIIAGTLCSGLVLLLLNFKNAILLRFTILIGPAMFAIWKYGMAREDYLHASMMFAFIVFIVILFNVLSVKNRLINAILTLLITISSFYTLTRSYYFEPYPIQINGFKTLVQKAVHYQYFVDTCNMSSYKQIERNTLEPKILKLIGNQSVDVYPWDYTYIASNLLNWQPRPVLQSYASYSRELDQLNADHFKSDKAPEFLIWELRKISRDIHAGTLESIDGRYLLNDEPLTLLEILKRYELAAKQQGIFPVLVFRKRKNILETEINATIQETVSWNSWIEIPQSDSAIVTASVDMQRNYSGKLKSFFYKDEATFVYYLLENGDIRMYRIVPKNSAYALWINPLIMNPESKINGPLVKKIMFRCSNTSMMKDKITISWKYLFLKPNQCHTINPVFDFFGIEPDLHQTMLLTSTNNLEQGSTGWSDSDISNIILKDKNHVFQLLSGQYSISYQFYLDSIKEIDKGKKLVIRTSVWAMADLNSEAVYVISVEKNGESLIWKAVDIQNFIHNPSVMNFVANFVELDEAVLKEKGLTVKIYAWNSGRKKIILDDFSVRVETW